MDDKRRKTSAITEAAAVAAAAEAVARPPPSPVDTQGLVIAEWKRIRVFYRVPYAAQHERTPVVLEFPATGQDMHGNDLKSYENINGNGKRLYVLLQAIYDRFFKIRTFFTEIDLRTDTPDDVRDVIWRASHPDETAFLQTPFSHEILIPFWCYNAIKD
jgi:hypothetical protein